MLPRPTAWCDGLCMPWCADLSWRHVAMDQPSPCHQDAKMGIQSAPSLPLSLIAGSEHHFNALG